ncbi:MAG: hypothetical protein H6739_24145 [Alphaproteobacteria bacterium]|nr:hypothetical protein [Alphaproteobacteria bacterium]
MREPPSLTLQVPITQDEVIQRLKMATTFNPPPRVTGLACWVRADGRDFEVRERGEASIHGRVEPAPEGARVMLSATSPQATTDSTALSAIAGFGAGLLVVMALCTALLPPTVSSATWWLLLAGALWLPVMGVLVPRMRRTRALQRRLRTLRLLVRTLELPQPPTLAAP